MARQNLYGNDNTNSPYFQKTFFLYCSILKISGVNKYIYTSIFIGYDILLIDVHNCDRCRHLDAICPYTSKFCKIWYIKYALCDINMNSFQIELIFDCSFQFFFFCPNDLLHLYLEIKLYVIASMKINFAENTTSE